MEMNQQMAFPETFEGFAKEYGFKDDKDVYSNGVDLIPVFRVKQWLEQDNKLRAIETDTAYECGKHANKWIPVSERLPENFQRVLVTIVNYNDDKVVRVAEYRDWCRTFQIKENREEWEVGEEGLLAWMPLPDPYQSDESVERG